MVSRDDWRRMGQEEYLSGVKLYHFAQFSPYSKKWDHEHCEFCGARFSENPEDEHEGWCTTRKNERTSRFICQECFRDFKEEFGWISEEERDKIEG